MKFIDFANDVISHVSKFETMEHIVLTPEDGGVVAKAFAKNSTVLVESDSVTVEGVTVPACLGNLKYLGKVCSMDQFSTEKSGVNIVEGKDSENADVITNVIFTGPRIKVSYEAVDPKVAGVKIPNLKIDTWDVEVELTPEHSREFADIYQLQKLADPKSQDFYFSSKGEELHMSFGTGNKEISLTLSETGGAELAKSVYFNAARFQILLGIVAADGGGVLSICSKALKLITASKEVNYTFILPATTTPR